MQFNNLNIKNNYWYLLFKVQIIKFKIILCNFTSQSDSTWNSDMPECHTCCTYRKVVHEFSALLLNDFRRLRLPDAQVAEDPEDEPAILLLNRAFGSQ
jgi:hypothetical protein